MQLYLTDVQVAGIDTGDYPDFCDAYITYVCYEHNGRELTDSELEYINENCRDLIYELVLEYIY